jgi:hypothetical protein
MSQTYGFCLQLPNEPVAISRLENQSPQFNGRARLAAPAGVLTCNGSVLQPFARHPPDWSAPTSFNFDEFDVIHKDGRVLYTQEIVFGNGWLLHLQFRDVQTTLAHPLYLAPQPVPALVGAPFSLRPA